MIGKHLIARMNRYALSYLFLALLSLSPALAASEFQIVPNSVVVLADVDAARKALRIEDDFIRALSDFDRASRMKSEQPVSREEFLKFIEGEALAWTDQDIARIEKAVTGARGKLSKFELMLPERVLLVQTSGREEAHSAYCRSTNIIAIASRFVNGPAPTGTPQRPRTLPRAGRADPRRRCISPVRGLFRRRSISRSFPATALVACCTSSLTISSVSPRRRKEGARRFMPRMSFSFHLTKASPTAREPFRVDFALTTIIINYPVAFRACRTHSSL